MNLPRNSEARPKVVLDRSRREELLACQYYVAEVRIILEGVGNARCLPGHTAQCRHCRRANDPALILQIKRVPEPAVGSLWLSEVVVPQAKGQRQIRPHLPLILNVGSPRSVAEGYFATCSVR